MFLELLGENSVVSAFLTPLRKRVQKGKTNIFLSTIKSNSDPIYLLILGSYLIILWHVIS